MLHIFFSKFGCWQVAAEIGCVLIGKDEPADAEPDVSVRFLHFVVKVAEVVHGALLDEFLCLDVKCFVFIVPAKDEFLFYLGDEESVVVEEVCAAIALAIEVEIFAQNCEDITGLELAIAQVRRWVFNPMKEGPEVQGHDFQGDIELIKDFKYS